MLKTTLLILSLGLNAWLATRLVWPVPPSLQTCRTDDGPWMTCRAALDAEQAKGAAMNFAQEHGGSLVETHAFLKASGYDLQAITPSGARTYFSYAPNPPDPSQRWTPEDGTFLVRLMTNLDVETEVIAVGP